MPSQKNAKKIAVLGATGLVGRCMLETLEKRNYPVNEIIPLSSPRSAGSTVNFCGQSVTVREVTKEAFDGVDVALFSAGSGPSKQWAPIAAAAGAVVIDNSSAWRMDEAVPLVVPEVNASDIECAKINKNIIANPNCATIQAVCALYPLHLAAELEYFSAATYQSVSGTGLAALEELASSAAARLENKEYNENKVYPHPIGFNLLPHIGAFDDEGISEEEWKMLKESRKIMHLPNLRVSCTTVRVPVFRGHGEAIVAQFKRPISADEAREILSKAPGVEVFDNPCEKKYPLPIAAEGKYPVYVGRIRRDTGLENGLAMWVVADNLLKGAALNAVQIAELL